MAENGPVGRCCGTILPMRGAGTNRAATGTMSGCLVWIIACVVIGMCVVPISCIAGGFTATTDFAVEKTGAIVCPDNTTPRIRSFATYGSGPSTTSVLECVDPSGEVVKEDAVVFAFLWVGIIGVIALLLSGALAFLLAAPAGVLIAKFASRSKKSP